MASWFDEDGVLLYDLLEKDVTELHHALAMEKTNKLGLHGHRLQSEDDEIVWRSCEHSKANFSSQCLTSNFKDMPKK